MRVLVTGGRHYNDRRKLFAVLDAIHNETPISAIIQGGASGADSLAGRWADFNSVLCTTEPANWSDHGPAAGPIRNSRMLELYKPDLVVAFPGGTGTADMIRKAKVAGIELREIE